MATNNIPEAPCIAYLLSQYPAISHTFFLNEVSAMREHGFRIETASVNSIQPPEAGFPAVEMEEAGRTFYIKESSKAAILGVVAKTIVTRPGVFARGLLASLKLRPWDIPGTGYALFYLLEAILLGDWMLRKGCSHLHVHFGGSVSTVGLLTSIAWQVPYSLTIHGPEEFYDVGSSFLERKIARATFVTCISFFCRSQLLKISPVAEWEKFHVCRLGVRTDVFAPESAPGLEPRGEVLHIVSVGRLHPAKGQMILLHSMRELLRQGLRIRLSIVGDGGGRAELQEYIRQNGLETSVKLHGALSHPATRELLRKADLFVLASFAEGVPVALMEAMSMEIPCISSYVAGIPELIESSVDGLLVPASSAEDLTAAVLSLAIDPEKRRALALAGRRKILSTYDLSSNIKRLIRVFEQHGLVGEGTHQAAIAVSTAETEDWHDPCQRGIER